MFEQEFENNSDDTGIVELIELFERYLQTKEHIYLDEEALERILEFYEMRTEDHKAEALVDFAIDQNPYSANFIISKAEYLMRRKKFTEALEFLDKAALYDASELDIYLIRADIYLESNEIEKALDTLTNALSLIGNDEKDAVYAEMSDIYEIKEDFDAALDCLIKALEYNPNSEDALHKVAHIVDMTDKYQQSIELHTKIVDKEPYTWLAWYNLGRAYAGVNLYERAIEAYEFVTAINEDFDYAYRELADVYFRLDNFKKAIEMFELAQHKSGGFEDYSFRIGLCHERLNDLKAARFNFRKAGRQDPYFAEAFFRIGETYRIEERYEAALVNYKKALKLDEDNEDFIVMIISVYKMLDKDDEAINYMHWLVNIRPDILTYWLDLIVYLYELGKFDEVEETTSEAVNRCGHYSEYFYIKAAALFHLGKEKESTLMLEEALTMDFARNSILFEIDEIFFLNEKTQLLIDLFKPQ